MDDLRVGSAFRAIRIRRGLRQIDVARLARVSTSTVSRIERGYVGSLSLDAMRAVGKALEIRVELIARWKAGDLDRLLNARHSRLHDLVAEMFDNLPDWVIRPEVSFAIYGERGVIDILAWNPRRRMLLVIELKTDIVDLNDLVGSVDRKRRNAVAIATELGWLQRGEPPPSVATWIIVSESTTNRRRVRSHQSMLRAAFPSDGRSIHGWLKRPTDPIRALSFWADTGTLPRGVRLAPPRRVARARAPERRSD
jgi:transcriptional regulator with XRE-family HTH domain